MPRKIENSMGLNLGSLLFSGLTCLEVPKSKSEKKWCS
jgi:hypothetical protein